MKTTYKSLALTAILGASAFTLDAQQLYSAYFSDSYLYRHEMNPAMGNQVSYFSIPGVLGNMNLNLGSNFGVKNFLFENPNKNGRALTTFMDQSVSADKFLGDLKDVSTLQTSFDYTIFSMGVKTKKSYHTLEVGSHMRVGLNLPKDLFAFMKEMKSDVTYNFGDMNLAARAYGDISYGYSRDVLLGIRVGAKFKYLVGVGNAHAEFTGCQARFGQDKWTMKMNGQVDMAIADGAFERGDALSGGRYEIDGYDVDGFDMAGKGFAVDLGVTWDLGKFTKLLKGLRVSVAVNDIGSIKWTNNSTAIADGKPFEFAGFKEISTSKSDPNSLKNQWDKIEDDLEDMYRLSTDGKTNTLKETLGATFTAGVEYELRSWHKLSFGAVYTKRFSDYYDYQEGRVVCNLSACRFFDFAISGSYNTFGPSVGAVANLALPGLNLFIATDNLYLGSVNKDYIPLENGSMSVAVGLNFPLGAPEKHKK